MSQLFARPDARVAPRAGAWIETIFDDAYMPNYRRTPCGAWIETLAFV